MAKLFKALRKEIVVHDDTGNMLADVLGITPPTLSRKLTGKCEWRLSEMYSILDRYGIPYEQMPAIFPKGGVRVVTTDCDEDFCPRPRRV